VGKNILFANEAQIHKYLLKKIAVQCQVSTGHRIHRNLHNC